MNINDLTIGQAKELIALFQNVTSLPTVEIVSGFASESLGHSSYPVGKNVIVRTVTMIYTGRLDHVTSTDLVLVDCSWIPETERFMKFVAEGAVKECEPYPDGLPVYINRGALLDMCELRKELPRSQK